MMRRLLSQIFSNRAGVDAQPARGVRVVRLAGLLLATLCTLGSGLAKAQSYCTPSYGYSWYNCYYGYNIKINSFSLSGESGSAISEGSLGCDYGGQYFDRTSLGSLVTLYGGNSYNASIDLGYSYGQYYVAWIDFNDDGNFDNSEVINTTGYPYGYGYGYTTFTVTIPTTANAGNHRLRVRSSYYYVPDGCSEGYYGEARDYMVQVIPPVAVTPVPAICTGTSVTLNASNATTYSWAPATGLNVTTGASVVATPSVTTTYTVSGTSIYGTRTATVTVTVHDDITPIVGNTTLNSAIPAQLTNEMTGGSWASASSAVATVGTSGLVTAVAPGATTISYTVVGCPSIATTNVTVTNVNTALNFNGADNYVHVADGLSSSMAEATYEAWVKPTGLSGLEAIANADGWDWGYVHFQFAGTGLGFSVNGSYPTDQNIAYTFSNGTWYHIACVYSTVTNTVNFYVNGQLTNTAYYSYSVPVAAGVPFSIGAWLSGGIQRGMPGNIDEVRIWSVARTQDQIQANMSCDVAQQAGLVAYYRFDQGTAGGTNTGMTSAFDYSGNNHCGTLNNFTLSGGSSNYVTGAVGSCNTIVPVQNITGNAPVCLGATLSLSSATANGSWSTSDVSIATVDATTGVVTSVAAGSATIAYTLCGASTSTIVTVNPVPAAISGTAVVCNGYTTSLSNSVSGGSWTSADQTIASVLSTGVVTGAASGNVAISYTLPEGCFTTKTVTVNQTPAAITGTTGMCAGNTTALSSATTGGAWSSANNAVASVGTDGVVTSRNTAGITTISYTLPTTGCYVTSTINNMVAAISGSQGICSGLTATVADATAGGTWSSSSATIAAIGTNGVITAGAGGGTATISYTASGCYRTSPFTVSTTPGPITGTPIVCSGYSTTLYNSSPGGTWSPTPTGAISSLTQAGVVTGANAGTALVYYRLSATCYSTVVVTVNPLPYAIGGTPRVCPGTTTSLGSATTGGTWSSSDSTLATVSSSGMVSGIVAGTPVITYTAGGCFRTIAVTVNPNPPVITGGTLINVGATSVLSETATNGTGWSSSNTAVATVGGGTSSGTVTGIAVGNAIITYTSNTGCYATTQVTVATLSAISGPTKACLGVPATYSCGSPGGVWSVSNPSVATIDPALGTLTGISQGTLIVSYTQGPLYKTLNVTVNPLPTPITGSQVMCVGTSSLIVSNGNAGTWASSNTAVASFPSSANGTMNGIGVGVANVTFTAQVSGCITTAVVTVNPALTANTGTANACIGTSSTLANSAPAGTWSSSNTAVASVDAATGVVTAIGAGTTTISYALSPNCRVTTTYTSKALPNAITGASSVCMPVTTTLTSTTTGGIWSSSNATIATVGSAINSTYGVVTGASSGAATITYTIPATGCYRTAAVTVASGLNPGTISSSNGFALKTVSTPHTATLSSTGAAGGAWSSSNSAIASVDPVTGIVTGVAAGSATITYSVTGACTNTTTHAITVAAGRDGNSAPVTTATVDLYPNPTTGAFTVTASQEGTLRIFTLDGKELASHTVAAGATTLSMPSGAAAGIYMCRFTAEDGSNVVFRLVLEN